MSSSFDFTDIERFTAGAVGEPGERVFYLQVDTGEAVVSFRCEKQQVSALATYLSGILRDLPPPAGSVDPAALELAQPLVPEWVIGSMGMAYDEQADRLVLLAEELVDEEGEDADGASARFHLTREQAAAFVDHAEEVVASGRPTCPICGLPMNPEGHTCPRSNGHGRP